MDYEIVSKININYDRCVKIGAFLYDKDVDGIYHESPWPFPVQIGFTHGMTKCYVTPMFIQLPFIMKGWINHDILLREIKLMKLALTGKILMHGSCVDNTLIVGLPNSGKTYQTYKTVLSGGTLISEEYTVISRIGETKKWKAEPFEPVMRTCFSGRTLNDCGIPISFGEKVWLAAATVRAKLFPFMYEAVIWKKIRANGGSSNIKKIVYGSTGVEIKDWRKFAVLCENEFPFMSSELLQAYSLVAGLDLIYIQNEQRTLIRRFVDDIYPDPKP